MVFRQHESKRQHEAPAKKRHANTELKSFHCNILVKSTIA